jgi:uncharacterized membrane protein
MAAAPTTDDGDYLPQQGHLGLYPGDLLRLVAIAVFAIAALIAVTADWQSPVRVVLTLSFMLFGPGLAIGELLEISDPVQRIALATGAGLALETLVATALFYAGQFSIEAACGVIVGITCLALLGAAWRRGFADGPIAPDETRGAAT